MTSAMSQQDNLAIVKEIYDAVGRGDVAAILDRVSDDVDWAAEAASKTAPWYGPRQASTAWRASSATWRPASRSARSHRTASPPARTTCTCSSTGPSGRSRPAVMHR